MDFLYEKHYISALLLISKFVSLKFNNDFHSSRPDINLNQLVDILRI